MQLPKAAMTSNAAVNDSNTTTESILMRAIITDIVRLQGEELIRVRSELEKAQSLNASALELMRATECRMSELQDTSHQRRLKMLALQETLTEMQSENDDLSNSLEITRKRLRVFCGLVEQPSPKQGLKMEHQNNLHSFQDQSMLTEGDDALGQRLTEEGVNTTAITPKHLSTEAAREGAATTSSGQVSTVEDSCDSSLQDVVPGPGTDISSECRRSQVEALDLHGAVQQGGLVLKGTDRSRSEPFSTGVEQWYNTSDPSSLMDESNGNTGNSNGSSYPEDDVDVIDDRLITPFDVAYSSDEEDPHLVHVAVLSTDEQPELDRVKNLTGVVSHEMGMSKPVLTVMEPIASASKHEPMPLVNVSKYPSQPAPTSAEPAANASKPRPTSTPAPAATEPVASIVEPKPSHTLVESATASQYASSSRITQFVTASTLCNLPITLANLPQNPGDKSKVEQICSKALGYSPTFLEGPYLKAKLVVDLHNQDSGILIVVSKNDITPCKLLKKCKTGTSWKQTFIAIDYGGSVRNLYILGEYEYRGYSPTKLALSDYHLLPEAAKDFVFDSGRGIRNDIKMKEHVAESLVKQDGIAIHKIVLEAVRSKDILKELIVDEAHSKGHY